ncbi:MAG: hypothetical protein RLP97_04440 [Coleofasciculus chthonoplastes F2-STO-03]
MQRLYNGAERPNRCVYCYNGYVPSFSSRLTHPTKTGNSIKLIGLV